MPDADFKSCDASFTHEQLQATLKLALLCTHILLAALHHKFLSMQSF